MNYMGKPLGNDDVQLVEPEDVPLSRADEDVRDELAKWSRAAHTQGDIVYFHVEVKGERVGQFFLHDIDQANNEALVGYHLFRRNARGKGIGKKALALLIRYARTETELRQLTIITKSDNIASRKIAESNGFIVVGTARENPDFVCYQLSVDK